MINNYLLIAAGLIIATLAIIAGYYLYQLRKLRERQKQAEDDAQRYALERAEKNRKSIKIIAQGLIDEQLTLTEGSIRITVLMENLPIEQSVREEFSAFRLLAEATSHIPILEDWKKLKTKQKLEFDRQRQKLESDHREFVLDASRRVIQHPLI